MLPTELMNLNENKFKQFNNLIKNKNFVNNLDYIITLCADEVCPVLNSSAVKLHWINADPVNINSKEADLHNAFTRTRNDLYKLIKKFTIEVTM